MSQDVMEEGINNDEIDKNESLNQEEASINNNDSVDASINNKEDDNNMDIDAIDYFNQAAISNESNNIQRFRYSS